MSSGKGPRPKRARTVARASERTAKRLLNDRERLFAFQDGASAEHPLNVSSASLVEPRARGIACPRCEGELDLVAHDAASVEGVRLRRVSLTCRRCAHPRSLWFRIVGDAVH